MIFFLPSFHLGEKYMSVQWAAGFIVLSLYWCMQVRKHFGLLQALTAFYILCQSVIYLHLGAFYVAVAFILMGHFAMNVSHNHLRHILWFIPYYTMLNAAYVVYGQIMGTGRLSQGVGFSGVLDYSGMNAVLLSFGVPFLVKEGIEKAKPYAIFGLCLTAYAVAISAASVPYGVITVSLLAYYFKKEKWFGLGPLVLFPIGIGIMVRGTELLNDAYRFKAYQVFMTEWWDIGQRLFGTGSGSFPILSTAMQVKRHFMVDFGPNHFNFIWTWMHCDYPLQTLFEYGFIGMFLVGASFIQIAYRIYKQDNEYAPALFSLAIAIAGSALFDYPVRYYMTAFFITLIVAAQFSKETQCVNYSL